MLASTDAPAAAPTLCTAAEAPPTACVLRGSHPRCAPHRPHAAQVKDSRDLPWAIVGTVGVSTLLYILLALSLALMVYPSIGCPSWEFFLAGTSDSVQQTVSFLSAFVSGHCEMGFAAWWLLLACGFLA